MLRNHRGRDHSLSTSHHLIHLRITGRRKSARRTGSGQSVTGTGGKGHRMRGISLGNHRHSSVTTLLIGRWLSVTLRR